ncbi:MAG TPA: hypothetical protein VGK67_08260 [Myxococcales bacterium]
MSECPNLQSCPMLQQATKSLPAVANLVKQQICQGAYGDCACFRVFVALGSRAIPVDLYPTQHERATALIAEGIARQQRRPGLLPNAA